MPSVQSIIDVFGDFLGYAAPITIIMAIGKAGLGMIYHAIYGRE